MLSRMESPFSVAETVKNLALAALVKYNRPVGVAMVAAGGLVVDDCCAGLLLVAPERVYRTVDPFPTEAREDARCAGNPIAVDLVVVVYRCVPVIKEDGSAPTPGEQEEGLNGILTDGGIVWGVLAGSGLTGDDGYGDPAWERANLNQLFSGPEGGCVAVETRVTVGVGQRGWCLPGESSELQ